MVLTIFAVYDSKVEAYLPPFFMLARGAAMRSFIDQVNAVNKPNELSLHPEDYTLFELGVWEDSKASFELLSTPKSLMVGSEVKE